MNDVAFTCIRFELTAFNYTTLNKQGSTHKNTCHKWLVRIFDHILI